MNHPGFTGDSFVIVGALHRAPNYQFIQTATAICNYVGPITVAGYIRNAMLNLSSS